jgi:hypothetical protein
MSRTLALYKQLQRTITKTLRNEQHAVILKARSDCNSRFKENKCTSDPKKLAKQIKLAEDVERTLRMNVVFAKKSGEDTFELEITSDTELGLNDSVKKGGCKADLKERSNISF